MTSTRTRPPAKMPAGGRRARAVAGKTANGEKPSVAETKPVVAETPTATEPVASKPAARKPATKRPAAKKPVTTKPSATSRDAAEAAKPKPAATSGSCETPTPRALASRPTSPLRVRAAVDARRATMDATTVRLTTDVPVTVDAGDHDAIDRLARKAVPVETVVASAPPATGAALLDRVVEAIESELTQIENLVGGKRVTKTQRTDAERRARTLASLTRTLSEVARLRGFDRTKPDHEPAAHARDLDAFRLDLARRLDGLVAEAKALHPVASG